jgi:hypothetical protein
MKEFSDEALAHLYESYSSGRDEII